MQTRWILFATLRILAPLREIKKLNSKATTAVEVSDTTEVQ